MDLHGNPGAGGSDALASGPPLPLIEGRGLTKRYGGICALDDVSIAIAPSRVHALVGENGAGKSTLTRILGGAHAPDEGELRIDGEPVRFRSPRQALSSGVAMIAQEIALVPGLTVRDNVMLGIEPNRSSIVRRGALASRFDELNERSGFQIDGGMPVRRLRAGERQKTEVLRAIAHGARLILMDEPTASLTADEAERLLETIRDLSESGTSVLLISHKLDEVLSVADEITVMRDGRVVRTGPAAGETPERLIADMIGRSLAVSFPPKRPPAQDEPPVLEVRGLTRAGVIHDVSFSVRPGEIVGLAGLVGSGRTEVARAIFGADRFDSGEVLMDGEPLRLRHPRDAMDAGIAMLPEERKEEGLLMLRSVGENTTLASLREIGPAGIVSRRSERRAVASLVERLDVKTASANAPVSQLSGGNQQKVLFAKWLMRKPRVLIADEPTRGVDVGAKHQIYELLAKLAADGMAVTIISSELEEVLGMAHRVLVLREGHVVERFDGEAITAQDVMQAAFLGTAGVGRGAGS